MVYSSGPLSSSSSDLARRIRAGDAGAFEELIRAQHEGLCRFAHRYLRDASLAEDLVQELFADLWADHAHLELRGSVRAYLYSAARNRALVVRRHRLVEQDPERDEPELDVRELGSSSRLGAERTGAATYEANVGRVIQALPERWRITMQLRWREELSHAEIASVMGISVDGVARQLSRGLHVVRRGLAASRSRLRFEQGAADTLAECDAPDALDWRIIDRQLAGEASSGDEKALRRWLAADARHVELLGALREAAQSSRDAATEHWNVEAAWLRVAPRRNSDPGRPLELIAKSRTGRPSVPRRRRWSAWRMGGVAIAMALVAMLPSAMAPVARSPLRRAANVGSGAGVPEPGQSRRVDVVRVGAHRMLVLDGMTLAEAATEIGRRFGARIVVADRSLAVHRVSARFRDESLAGVLDALTRKVGARWRLDGGRVVIASAR